LRDLNYRLLAYSLSWLLLAICHTSVVLASEVSSEEDTNTTQDQIEDLRDLLQVKDLRTPEIIGELTFDGKIDEPAWKYAAEYEIVLETYPARLEPAPVKTLVRIGRYEDDIVIAFDAHDPEPDNIQAPFRDRDGIELDDYVGISIDPAGQLLKTYEFYVNARGVQGDWVRNRVDDTRSRDWDADWISAASFTDTGYQVEMRIPIAELEMPTDDSAVRRFVLFKRHYPRAIRHHLTAFTVRQVQKHQRYPAKQFLVVPGVTLLSEHERNVENGEKTGSRITNPS
jgi:hypothetical protein